MLDGLQVQLQLVIDMLEQFDEMLCIEVMGNDCVGIVQEFINVLYGFNFNILYFVFICESVFNWGSQMFKVQLCVGVLVDLDCDDLQEVLEVVVNDLVVDIIIILLQGLLFVVIVS